jgi:hypothetical protein
MVAQNIPATFWFQIAFRHNYISLVYTLKATIMCSGHIPIENHKPKNLRRTTAIKSWRL